MPGTNCVFPLTLQGLDHDDSCATDDTSSCNLDFICVNATSPLIPPTFSQLSVLTGVLARYMEYFSAGCQW